jgi:hypothetical protein
MFSVMPLQVRQAGWPLTLPGRMPTAATIAGKLAASVWIVGLAGFRHQDLSSGGGMRRTRRAIG